MQGMASKGVIMANQERMQEMANEAHKVKAGEVRMVFLENEIEAEVEFVEVTDDGVYFKPTDGKPLPTIDHIPDRGYFASHDNIFTFTHIPGELKGEATR